jgi:aminoglycoside phosphotransferase (APT) family kinase protein
VIIAGVDRDRELLAVIRTATRCEQIEFCDPPVALTGGFWAELVRFRLTDPPPGWDGGLVARLMPDPVVAAKETAFQAGVAAQGYPTPSVLAAGGPTPGVNGRAFVVMPFAKGRPLLADLDGLGAIRRLPSLTKRLPAVLAGRLDALHRLDPAPVIQRLDATGVAVPGIACLLQHLAASAATAERPDLSAAAAWLIAHRPPVGREVICHGDLHPFNVLVDGDEAIVLDWSAAVIAPPEYDVGFTSLLLTNPPLVAPAPLRPLIDTLGRALARRFVRAYEDAAGPVDEESLRWHHAVVCLRALVEVAGWERAGSASSRRGHPWMISRRALTAKLASFTGGSIGS